MAKALVLLTLFHLVAFWRWYTAPDTLAAGEWLEQGFTSWRLCGRQGWRVHDPYYYPNFTALPFLSSFYPPHRFSAWLTRSWSVDRAWRIFLGTMAAHFWLCSIAAYILLLQPPLALTPWAAGFVALTLSHTGYALKPCASIIYTTAWIPIWLLAMHSHTWGLSGLSLGMMLLAGYWPIALPAIGVGCLSWWLSSS